MSSLLAYTPTSPTYATILVSLSSLSITCFMFNTIVSIYYLKYYQKNFQIIHQLLYFSTLPMLLPVLAENLMFLMGRQDLLDWIGLDKIIEWSVTTGLYCPNLFILERFIATILRKTYDKTPRIYIGIILTTLLFTHSLFSVFYLSLLTTLCIVFIVNCISFVLYGCLLVRNLRLLNRVIAFETYDLEEKAQVRENLRFLRQFRFFMANLAIFNAALPGIIAYIHYYELPTTPEIFEIVYCFYTIFAPTHNLLTSTAYINFFRNIFVRIKDTVAKNARWAEPVAAQSAPAQPVAQAQPMAKDQAQAHPAPIPSVSQTVIMVQPAVQPVSQPALLPNYRKKISGPPVSFQNPQQQTHFNMLSSQWAK